MRMWIAAIAPMLVLLGSGARADDGAGVHGHASAVDGSVAVDGFVAVDASVAVDGFVVDGVIVEGKVVYADHVLPHALVRVVGERVVVIARADARGHVHVSGLPPGRYRIELERGALADHAPVREPRTITVDDVRRREHWCVLPIGARTFNGVIGIIDEGPRAPFPSAPLGAARRSFVDTSSSALVTTFVFAGH